MFHNFIHYICIIWYVYICHMYIYILCLCVGQQACRLLMSWPLHLASLIFFCHPAAAWHPWTHGEMWICSNHVWLQWKYPSHQLSNPFQGRRPHLWPRPWYVHHRLHGAIAIAPGSSGVAGWWALRGYPAKATWQHVRKHMKTPINGFRGF